jgi:hypothetical protein
LTGSALADAPMAAITAKAASVLARRIMMGSLGLGGGANPQRLDARLAAGCRARCALRHIHPKSLTAGRRGRAMAPLSLIDIDADDRV